MTFRHQVSVGARIAWYFLVAQFVATAVLSICVALAVKIDNEQTAGALVGLLMVQILLLAVWSALGPLRTWLRVGSAAIAALFFAGCFYRVAWRDGGGHDVAMSISIPMLVQWALLQVPLWIARRAGWRVHSPNGTESNNLGRAEFQFGIKQLLIWTTVVAICAAVIRAVVDNVDLSNGGGGGGGLSTIEAAIHLTMGNSLIAFPIIWGAFARKRAWLWPLISIGVCIIVCGSEAAVLTFRSLDVSFFWMINISQTILALFIMAIVRQLGMRLHPPLRE